MTRALLVPDAAPGVEPDPPGRWTAPARRWLPTAGPGLLMLAVGLVGATTPTLSWDEIATADAARRSVGQIWHLLQHVDGVFGPYYLFMHLWTTVAGASVLSLRLPSILAMAAAVAITAELGRHVFGPVVGAVGGVLLCLLPNISRYAAEARPYAMVCMFSVLALLLLYRVLERPSPLRWAGYAAATVAVGMSSLVGLAALAGHLALVGLAVRRHPRQWRALALSWGAAVAATLLVLSPLIWWGLRERAEQLYWVPPLTWGGVYVTPGGLVGSPEAAWLLIGLLIVALARRTGPVAEMAAAAVLPVVVVGVVSLIGPSFWVYRYLLFALLPLALVAAGGLARFRRPELGAALVVVLAAALPGQVAVRRPDVKNGSDYRTLAAVVRTHQEPGDDIVFQRGRTMRTGVEYYLRGDRGRPRDVLMQRSAAQTATLTASEFPDAGARLATASRIWLIAYGRRTDPTAGRPDLRQLLRSQYRRAGLWLAKLGTVALYTRR